MSCYLAFTLKAWHICGVINIHLEWKASIHNQYYLEPNLTTGKETVQKQKESLQFHGVAPVSTVPLYQWPSN